MVKKKWKPTHSQVVGTAAALPGLLLIGTRGTSHALLSYPVRYLLAHTSIAGAVVAAASTKLLCKFTTGLFGKSKQGKLSLLCCGIFYPFQVAIRTKLLYRRRHGTEPLYSHVVDKYWIGGWPNSPTALPDSEAAVVDCTCELPRRHSNPYLCVATWDTHSPSIEGFDQGVEFATEQRKDGRPILVHCAHGHGRSAAMLCAILISAGKAKSINDAEAMLQRKRPRVRLNKNQREGLTRWLEQKHKKK